MSRIVIYNTTVLTLDDEDTFYYPGTVEIVNDRIAGVYGGSPSAESLTDPTTTVIDGTDKLGFGDELPLKEYLEEVWYPSVRALNEERTFVAAMHSYCAALKSGTTTVNDMYRFVGARVRAADEIGIRATLGGEIALAEHGLDSLADNEAAFWAHNKQQRLSSSSDGRVRVWLGLEWMLTSDLALLQAVGRAKKALGTGLHLHLCESEGEVVETRACYGGRSPVQLAYEAGLLGPDTVAAHCVHLDDEDVQLLAATGTSVSYDAGSNAKLGNGIARLQDLLAAGVNVGIGIDAFECENSPDMFAQMKIASLVQRALHRDASLGRPHEILRMATRNGAHALGIDAGVVREGAKADLIVLDLTHNHMFTPLLHDPARRKTMLESHLVFGCNGSAVQHSIVDGKIVLRDFQILAIDEEDLRKQMDALFEDIAREMPSLVRKVN
ncbi:n-ethylammeline chlorohydrolase [Grosmannia clavigera kw1407]|uniref:N-ethylammeline chlorohydrolase n=1 Tax=Grosmannia clavigera (strain kw1407 / UAMH 11150) TaxID=655863 RepID=F0XB79_GROCL|nr:n-ethylammeline chlorohydrolase [Grosmannia clavigera kw1407]EFX04857.1 n-ethylammeline chlorohydrolase [Grosmannia clavigera kw1407]